MDPERSTRPVPKSPTGTVDIVATHNIKKSIPDSTAGRIMRQVLTQHAHGVGVAIVGFQEWNKSRDHLFRENGDQLIRFPRARRTLERLGGVAQRRRTGRFTWVRPLQGPTGPIGFDSVRYELRRCYSYKLSSASKVPPTDKHPRAHYWANRCAVAELHDDYRDERVVAINIHLLAGVQGRGGRYNDDRVRVEIHKAQRRALEELVAGYLDRGWTVWVLGDSNFDGFTVHGLTSSFAEGDHRPTHGVRTIDDVFGPGAVLATWLLHDPSDHNGVTSVREREA